MRARHTPRQLPRANTGWPSVQTSSRRRRPGSHRLRQQSDPHRRYFSAGWQHSRALPCTLPTHKRSTTLLLQVPAATNKTALIRALTSVPPHQSKSSADFSLDYFNVAGKGSYGASGRRRIWAGRLVRELDHAQLQLGLGCHQDLQLFFAG